MAKSWLEGGPGTEFAEPADLSFGVTSATPSQDGQVVTLADRASNSVVLDKQFEEMESTPSGATWLDPMSRWEFPETVEYGMDDYERVYVNQDNAKYVKIGAAKRQLYIASIEEIGDDRHYVQVLDNQSGSLDNEWYVDAAEVSPGIWSLTVTDDSAGVDLEYVGPLEEGNSYDFTVVDSEGENTVYLHRVWSGASVATIKFPARVQGKLRQFILRVSSSIEGGGLPTLIFGPNDAGNQAVALEDGAEMPSFRSAVTVVRFTETAPGKFVPERLLPVGGDAGGSVVGSVFKVMDYGSMDADIDVLIGTITAVDGNVFTVNIDPSVVHGFDENPVTFDLGNSSSSAGMFGYNGEYTTTTGGNEDVYDWEWSGMDSDFSGGIVFRLNS